MPAKTVIQIWVPQKTNNLTVERLLTSHGGPSFIHLVVTLITAKEYGKNGIFNLSHVKNTMHDLQFVQLY